MCEYYYIRIDNINGRNDFYQLVNRLHTGGYKQVEYCQGKEDYPDTSWHPHLRFNDYGDAIAYSLTYGGAVKTTIPTL